MPTFAELTESIPDALVPLLDRADPPVMDREQRSWRENGVLHLPGFMPGRLVDAYARVREAHGEYHTPIPYMTVPEIRDMCLYEPLMKKLTKVISTEVGLHLNLTGWVSTERDWHQDDYLNPPFIYGWYVAVWFALDEIHPDSGPFQYVPGSHRWPLLRRDRVLAHAPPEWRENPAWPKLTEPYVAEAMDAERKRRGLPVVTYLPKKGDVLIWHGRLMHRGSPPVVQGKERRSLIAHYSALSHRRDMPNRARHGRYRYFVLSQ